jgi:ribosomal protein S18 acetylase RimI-like enzyme
MTLPTFFIIGAAKAGTTSLHHYLEQHPEVQMSAVKETNFFAGPPNGIPYPFGRVDNLHDYEALFEAAFAVRGEASPSYTTAPRRAGVPQRIKELVPEALFIYLVRDPIDRLVSQYQMLVTNGKERLSFREALAQLNAADPHLFYLTCQSFYGHQLELYLEEFPQQQILVLDQARLQDGRDVTLESAFEFLGVDPGFRSPAFESELLKGGERRRYPRHLKPALRIPHKALPTRLRNRLRTSFERSFLSPVSKPELEPAERDRLRALFAPDTARLRELTGLRFETWSV